MGKIEVNRTSPKLLVRIIIKKNIISPIAPKLLKQKTSYSFGNFYINDC